MVSKTRSRRIFAAGLTVLMTLFLRAALVAQEPNGTCATHDFPLRSDYSINSTRPVRALKDRVVVYRDAKGNDIVTTVGFGHLLEPQRIGPDNRRVAVRETGAEAVLGWINPEDLLCAIRPLSNKKGLERKFFVKTDAYTTHGTFVTAYRSPGGNDCDSCKRLSRFEMYFIAAEDSPSGSYLLASQYNFERGQPLVGWVKENEGFEWDTALGIRPRDGVDDIKAFSSLAAASQYARKRSRIPTDSRIVSFKGGDWWYKTPMRIPLLAQVPYKKRQYYKVTIPGVGVRAFEERPRVEALHAMKHVDVFFLLDGTLSMTPFLGQAKEAARNIAEKLTVDWRYSESSFRFGFRVYRDRFVGEIGEGLPLSPRACEMKPGVATHNRANFEANLAEVKSSKNDKRYNDLYPEALFAGIRQATRDIISCPERTKILFIIGDAGDNQATLPQSLIQHFVSLEKTPVIYFVQAPKRQRAKTANWDAYLRAYNRFEGQSKELFQRTVRAVFAGNSKNIKVDDHYFSLDPQELPGRVLEIVGDYSQTVVANEIIESILGGEPLNDVLASLMTEGDIPAFYLELIRKSACQPLEELCTERIDHRVIEAYTPVSESWDEEVWVSSEDLTNWIAILGSLGNIESGTTTDKREEFGDALASILQAVLGQPPIQDSGETLGEFLRRKTLLPVHMNSPLTQYELGEIYRMEVCELNRLIAWVRSVRDLLARVLGAPNREYSRILQEYSADQCPLASAKGQKTPSMVIEDVQAFPEGMSYRQEYRGESRFWIPLAFLP